MNENAKKWVKALESGDYKQIQGALRKHTGSSFDEVGYCCLGVACDLYIKENPEANAYWNETTNEFCYPDFHYSEDISGDIAVEDVLPMPVQNWLGLNSDCGEYIDAAGYHSLLITLNDKEGISFEEIAQIIKSEPYFLFR